MKKILILTFALIIPFVSCTEEQETTMVGTKQKGTFKAYIKQAATYPGDAGTSSPDYWAEGDIISINGVASSPLNASFDGQELATFSVGGVSSPYFAAYPASAVSGYSSGTATITIPADQHYEQDSYDSSAYIMLCKSEDNTLEFVPRTAIFSLTPTGPGPKILSISLSSIGGVKIAGTFTTDFESLTASASAVSTVTVSSEDGVELGKTWMIPIPETDLSPDGIKVVITGINGDVMTYTTTPSRAYEAGKIYSTTVQFKADPADKPTITWAANPDFKPMMMQDSGINEALDINVPLGISTFGFDLDSEALGEFMASLSSTPDYEYKPGHPLWMDFIYDDTLCENLGGMGLGIPLKEDLLGKTHVSFPLSNLILLLQINNPTPDSYHYFNLRISDTQDNYLEQMFTIVAPSE